MMEYIYLATIVGIILWSLVNKLDDHAEMKQKERQLMMRNIARMNLKNSDKQFTYDVEPPEGLAKGVEEGVKNGHNQQIGN